MDTIFGAQPIHTLGTVVQMEGGLAVTMTLGDMIVDGFYELLQEKFKAYSFVELTKFTLPLKPGVMINYRHGIRSKVRSVKTILQTTTLTVELVHANYGCWDAGDNWIRKLELEYVNPACFELAIIAIERHFDFQPGNALRPWE